MKPIKGKSAFQRQHPSTRIVLNPTGELRQIWVMTAYVRFYIKCIIDGYGEN